jgi:acetolactate synthase-1/3 small subunit
MVDSGPSHATQTEEQHVLALLVRHRAGAIERVLGLLRRRAPHFSTICVAGTDDPEMLNVTITLTATRALAEHAAAHLRKLVDVSWASVAPATGPADGLLLREFALIQVACDAQNRREIVDLAHLFGARAADVTGASITLEVSGSHTTIDNLLGLLRPLGIREVTRTGQVALRRCTLAPAVGEEATAATG